MGGGRHSITNAIRSRGRRWSYFYLWFWWRTEDDARYHHSDEFCLNSSLTNDKRAEIKRLRDTELAKKLYQVQLEKCLVILNDIWATDAWDSLSPAFLVGKASNKMVLTTRMKEVGLHADLIGFFHKPEYLTDERSWELFQKKAFPRKEDPGLRIVIAIEALGRKMIKRCGGLPLAIVVLGGLTATKCALN